MLSDCTYSRLSSTNVLTDFVELPSQLLEHWFEETEVLKEYARHFETGEPVPEELLRKLNAARMFNQGFETIEYTACALLDMLLHQIDEYDNFDLSKFEKDQMARLGMPLGIVMRHRPAHFLHLFASTMYAAGYYGEFGEVVSSKVFMYGAFLNPPYLFPCFEQCIYGRKSLMRMHLLRFKKLAFLIQRQPKEFESMSILPATKRLQTSYSESSVVEILISSTCWQRRDWYPKG
jgi:Peptidase family M3